MKLEDEKLEDEKLEDEKLEDEKLEDEKLEDDQGEMRVCAGANGAENQERESLKKVAEPNGGALSHGRRDPGPADPYSFRIVTDRLDQSALRTVIRAP